LGLWRPVRYPSRDSVISDFLTRRSYAGSQAMPIHIHRNSSAAPVPLRGPDGRTQDGETGGLMLILTRKIDQAIVIQGDIKIMVLGVERDRVKIGIDAPANVTVLREELMDQQALPEPTPLRRKPAQPNLTPTAGALALKPEPKE